MTEHVRPPISRESVPFTPNLIGLQTRLLMGADKLNSATHFTERIDPTNIPRFDNRDYSPFEQGSATERTEFWRGFGATTIDDQLNAWSGSISSLISNKVFTDSEKRFYRGIGIDTDNFTPRLATIYYNEQFKDNPNKLKSFVQNSVLTHYDEATSSIDYDELRSNLNTITWFAHIFGAQTAEIVGQLVDAEVKLLIDPEFFAQEPDRLNNLQPKELEMLGFAWQYHTESRSLRPEPHADHAHEDEDGAYQIADRLVDYESGSVTDERVDLLPYYSGFVDDMRAKLDSNHPLFGGREPKIVLSDLAEAMIDRVASRSNEVNKELGFTIQGNNIGQEGELIFTGGYIVPVLDFTTAQASTMSPDFALNNRLKKTLGQNTNLSNYFLQTTGKETGERIGTLHIHQAPLGENYRAQPSTGDIAYVERILRETDREFYIWGVVTKSGGDLEMIVVLSKRDQSGTIVHEEIPVIYESQLEEALPQAA